MPEVTGAHHQVGLDDMFFSTTDAKGVIAECNSVFIRLSFYSREQLVNAPHNIIRHPVMPGGAFRAMWDTLESGEPFAAYVHNLAANGSQYDVFATITPLDGGYLSVRIRPTVNDLFAAADGIYQQVRALEDELLAQGNNRHQAAEIGAGRIIELLKQAGINSYAQFQQAALPAEIANREKLGYRPQQRPYAEGRLGEMLNETLQVYDELEAWMADQDQLAELSQALADGSRQVQYELDSSASTAANISNLSSTMPGFVVQLMPLQLWSSMEEEITGHLRALLGDIEGLIQATSEARFYIALARLQASMVAQFIAELIDGAEDTDRNAASIQLLCRALRLQFEQMRQRTQTMQQLAGRAAEQIIEASGLMQIPRDLIVSWSKESKTRQLPQSLADMVPEVTATVERANDSMDHLNSLAARCQNAANASRDTSKLEHLVNQLELSSRQY